MKSFKKSIQYVVYKLFGSFRNTFFVFLFLLLGLGYVLVRMKGVEQDYELHKINQKYQEVSIKNKELKAERASIYSAERLRKISADYKLAVPRQEQVIVISE